MIAIERAPLAAIIDNPLAGLRPQEMRRVHVGQSVADVIDELLPECKAPIICSVTGINGYLSRDDWAKVQLTSGDIVVFEVDPPQNRDLLRVALLIAVTYFSAGIGTALYGAGTTGALVTSTALTIAGSIAINTLLPPSIAQPSSGPAAGNVFASSLNGNEARIDQPIWKTCGRRKITPPFAGQPYVRYRDVKGTGFDMDQYFYAIFCVGIGDHEIESKRIADTTLSHFKDILTATYLAPGEQPTQAQANVHNVKEVSNISLDSGRYVGGFAACPAGHTITKFEVDMGAPRGMSVNGGAATMKWQVAYREIDDFNFPIGAWTVMATQSKTRYTNTTQRWTYIYELPSAMRIEVRLVRLDLKNTAGTSAHELVWLALRGQLTTAATLNPAASHFEIVMRASEQLNNDTNHDFSLILTGMARPYDPDSGGWGPYSPTRNPAYWCLDILTNPDWGLGLDDSRIDLPSFHQFALTCIERQDHFDYTFDSTVDGWEALQLIARAGRARCFRRFGVVSIARDELVTMPITAFTPRNTLPGSMVMTERHPSFDSADGVILEYTHYRTWNIERIPCPFPGVASPGMQNPVVVRLDGVCGPTHAHREGLYEAAVRYYRTRNVKCTTEMQAVLVNYMAACRWQPDLAGYGQSGDVTYWVPTTLVMGLSEPPIFTDGEPLYLTLMRDDGSLTDPVEVTPGPTAYDVTLPDEPDFDLILDDGARERPKFILGLSYTSDELVKILGITDGGQQDGAQLFGIDAVVDDERVHTADVALLPGPGDIQDPVGTFEDVGTGDPDLSIANLTDHTAYTVAAGIDAQATFTLTNTGVASWTGTGVSPAADEFDNEWSLFGIIEPTRAATFEVKAVNRNLYTVPDMEAVIMNPTSGSALDTWLNLGTTRSWTLFLAASDPVKAALSPLRIQIRQVGSTDIQASAYVNLHVRTLGTGSDGGDGGDSGDSGDGGGAAGDGGDGGSGD